MKLNKKVLIPVFATAMGLSVIGGITGAVAWYQYNSRVTTSFAGASVADTGVLQIGVMETNGIKWGRDVYDLDQDNKLYPVTFGQLDEDVQPANGKMYPEAGQYGYTNWQAAQEGVHYFQFELYFRALQANPDENDSGYTAVERNVYITDSILKCVKLDGTSDDDDKVAEEALRIHLQIEGQDDVMLSKTATELDLFGPLDLDRNNEPDTYHDTLFNTLPAGVSDGDPIEYGVNGEKQETAAIDNALLASRDSDGHISGGTPLFHTTDNENAPVKVVMTVWLEGWSLLHQATRAEWNPYYTAGTRVQAGLQFDTGIFRGDDLTPIAQP